MTEEDRNWNEYFIPGSENVFKKLIELYENPIHGNFDKKHLCDIHKYLFEDIYPFAG